MELISSGIFVSDSEIISEIDSLSYDKLLEYSNFYPQDLRHYIIIQKKWMQDEVYYLGIKLGHNPSSSEFEKDLQETKNAERFRAFYCLRYPEKIKK